MKGNQKIYVVSTRFGCTDPECCDASLSPQVAYTSREDAEHRQKELEELNKGNHFECSVDEIPLIGICLIEESK